MVILFVGYKAIEKVQYLEELHFPAMLCWKNAFGLSILTR